MKGLARLGGALALCWMAAGCATTGDPTKESFGWSEAKARDRQSEREEHLAGTEAELAAEKSKRHTLELRDASTEQQLAEANSVNERAQQKLRAQQAALVAKTEQLERESPTPAGASRARSWRLKINTVAAQTALPTAERIARLRNLETEIDNALARLRN